MFPPDQYSLVDFGKGRKLERFGSILLDRPCPAASGRPHRSPWSADGKYERRSGGEGRWRRENLPPAWEVVDDEMRLELKPTPFGHVGVFPEQAPNWDWVRQRVAAARRPLNVLNLFAYTGGTTLAAAAAGAEVTHVDSARNMVAWARRNAERSGLGRAPIRWLNEDARKFVRRELKRGRQYDAVVLDPPTYGLGTRGEAWIIARDLPALLADCGTLTASSRAFMLLTCHSDGFGPAELEALLADTVFGHCQSGARAQPLTLTAIDGRQLPCGAAARWPG